VSIGTFAALWLNGYRLPHPWALLVLGAIAAAAERQTVAIGARSEMSVAFLPLVFAAVAFGPLGGFVVGALSTALDLRTSPLKWSVYTPIRALETALAGLVVAEFVPHPSHFGQYLLASLVGSMVFLAADGFFTTATAFVRGNDAVAHLQAFASLSWITVPLYVPVLTLFVYAYHTYSLLLVFVFFVPTLAAQRLLHLYRQEKEATHRLRLLSRRLTPVTSTRQVIQPLSRSTPETSRNAWDCPRSNRNSFTCAASSTTLARSGFRLGFWKSRDR
jgi:hypothetical protein